MHTILSKGLCLKYNVRTSLKTIVFVWISVSILFPGLAATTLTGLKTNQIPLRAL